MESTNDMHDHAGAGPGADPVTPRGIICLGVLQVAVAVTLLGWLIALWPGCECWSGTCGGPQPAGLAKAPSHALSVEPTSGPLDGATVTLRGPIPAGPVRLELSTGTVMQAVASDGTVTVRMPRAGPGVVSIAVSSSGDMRMALTGGFVYAGPITVTGVSPSEAPAGCGAAVSLTGSGFGTGIEVKVGGLPAHVDVISETTLGVVLPRPVPCGTTGPVRFEARLGTHTATLEGLFRYSCPAPTGAALMVLVLLAGALGGALHALRSFYMYVGARRLVHSWIPMYVLLPLVGAVLALLFYIIVGAGLLPLTGTQPGYGVIGLAALVGLFSAQAIEKLKSIAEGVFSQPPRSSENLATPVLAINSISPSSVSVSQLPKTVTIRGMGFDATTTVIFGSVPATSVTFVSSQELVVDVPVPPIPPGVGAPAIDITVTRRGGTYAIKKAAFTYTP